MHLFPFRGQPGFAGVAQKQKQKEKRRHQNADFHGRDSLWARPGIEPGTSRKLMSRTLSENHTTRPSSQLKLQLEGSLLDL